MKSKENLISNFRPSLQIALPFEGTLFDAIVLVANTLNGMDPIDFPIQNEFRLDTRNQTQTFEPVTVNF